MGQTAGCLGRAYDPFAVPFVEPMGGADVRLDMRVIGSMFGDVEALGQGLARRQPLLDAVNHAAPALETLAGARDLDGFRRRAYELLALPASRDAFDLTKEPAKIRDAYGPA